jgi:2-polyprenyl-3-methyl-5-hydroxy-6-metoxy-1,4-benzoquinol methylase
MNRDSDVHLRSAPQLLEYRAITARLAADKAGRILDWGAGRGQVSCLLASHGLEVSAFDHDPSTTGGARTLDSAGRIELRLGPDPVSLPYADGSFDSVLSCGVLEHVPYPQQSLRELRRVLRSGGTLYVFKLPNLWFSYLERIARVSGLYYHGKLVHDRVYTRSSARAAVESAGFRVIELRFANMLPLTLQGSLATRLAEPLWLLNRALARVPLLNFVATNIELVATRP